ncbi:hypothetical protein DH2020_042996 [Rehmannia glutinosa]|uniref:Protein kinase domain-containing protein n=1 Tax=Rehmannia glutinosa TaxID=99300 RepID=A0ABR0UKX3_REHGL
MKIGVLVWVFLAALATTLLSESSLALSPDGVTLLEVKTSLNDTRNYLSNWKDTDESPCKWTGISCSPQDQRVISMALHQNRLHGIIPNEIVECSELRALYLRANYFQGGVPSTIGNLSMLTILDLSSNTLRGAIPSSLGRLTRLAYLNLSTNFLAGEIPDVGVLSKFGNTSFIGNLDLCGQQVNKPCRTSLGFPAVLPHAESDQATTVHKRSSRYIKGVVIGAVSMFGFAVVFLLGFLLIWLLTKKERAAKRYTEEPNLSLSMAIFRTPSCELVEKIESLEEEDIVGAGGFGTVYRMVMNDCGTFAVKKIDRTREGSDQVFERELEILGSVKHINLVNLRGYCRLPTAKLLIYDYLAKGSLDYFLHAYLHHDCSPKIIHRDIKSSNILLDEKLEPHVSDFGLAKLLVDEDAHVTTVVAGTFGYLAPEYLQSGRATEKSDVYSFGVLLLELVTGKRPTDPSFVKRGLNVVGWMNTLLRENRLKDVVDKRCPDAEVETVEVLVEIAARCTDANPDDRPSMQQVLQFLEQEVMSPCASEFYESHSDKC